MYCVALTGGIASGKSTVATFFLDLNIEVISADVIAKKLTSKGQGALSLIVEHFGASILTETQELNRRQLRHIIFKSKQERLWLENLLHPLIRQGIEDEVNQCKSPYCIIEIPLLVDKTDYPYLNRILLIQAVPHQLARLMTRDNTSEETAQAMLLAQPDEQLRELLADDRLINDGTLEQLQKKVMKLHQQYLSFAIKQ